MKTCSICGKECFDAEIVAYGRCENCWAQMEAQHVGASRTTEIGVKRINGEVINLPAQWRKPGDAK